ncbi:leucine-rich repeat-containing protein ODA7-like [Hyalella azteca]|uniref:Leucine-rich repeat-containing protein ODA7-like n=1 Tax=Hyalella azteca TaxID=294128 RepID=A0A8B7PIW9_HYAAZ|nr:leucine-rich repeat-containing protein ODA7-like [Hyalella azteca]
MQINDFSDAMAPTESTGPQRRSAAPVRKSAAAKPEVTHVHLQGRGISELKEMDAFLQARVMFLQHNLLQSTRGLNCLLHLQELYLQHNCITRLTGLQRLQQLRVLVLNHNALSVLEGLPPSLICLQVV